MLALGALAACGAPSAGAVTGGGPTATVTAAFRPNRLGAAATVSFAVRIDPPAQSALTSPISSVVIDYPADLGLATSGLGLQACAPAALELQGPEACPANSKLGEGSAVVEVPFGPTLVSEKVKLEIYATPSSDGYLHVGILAAGNTPVIGDVVFPGVLATGELRITVPPIASLPAAPYVELVRMQATLGGNLTYYESRRGQMIAYRPRGIGLPDSCPRRGWRFGASFQFMNGQRTSAQTAITCPPEAHLRGR